VATASTTRRCLFCEAAARSKEHLFPDWLNDVLPPARLGRTPEIGRHSADAGGVATGFWEVAEIASATARLVCHDCNTRWMAKLESHAKPVLEPMLAGHPVWLDRDQQLLVATWACKTAIVCEAALNAADPFGLEERQAVMVGNRPPASVEVFLAGVEGDIAPLGYSGGKVGVEVRGDTLLKYHFHTVQVATMVMHIVRRDPPLRDAGSLQRMRLPRELELPYGDALAVIFPPVLAHCPWPPKRILDWEGLIDLSKRGIDMPAEWTPPNPLFFKLTTSASRQRART
jgi:hypothetical protein